MKIIIYVTLFKGILLVWLCSMIASMWVNLYEDLVKSVAYLSNSTEVQSQSNTMVFRSVVVVVASLIYILAVNIWTPRLILRLWVELKDWGRRIDIDQLTYNALAPREPSRNE